MYIGKIAWVRESRDSTVLVGTQEDQRPLTVCPEAGSQHSGSLFDRKGSYCKSYGGAAECVIRCAHSYYCTYTLKGISANTPEWEP